MCVWFRGVSFLTQLIGRCSNTTLRRNWRSRLYHIRPKPLVARFRVRANHFLQVTQLDQLFLLVNMLKHRLLLLAHLLHKLLNRCWKQYRKSDTVLDVLFCLVAYLLFSSTGLMTQSWTNYNWLFFSVWMTKAARLISPVFYTLFKCRSPLSSSHNRQWLKKLSLIALCILHSRFFISMTWWSVSFTIKCFDRRSWIMAN